MAFTRTWNAAYEAQPADTENISLGASRIRNLKTDIQERLEVDHFHAGDAQDGEHKKLTLGAPIAKPANIANKGFLYGKDVNAKIELFYLDEDDNEVQLTSAGALNAPLNMPVVAKTADFTIVAADKGKLFDLDANAGAVTVTLILASGNDGFILGFKAKDVGNTITIDGSGAETIDGSITKTLDVVDDTLLITCDGTTWHIVAETAPVPTAQATQAAIEAETNEDTYIPPDLLKHNPGVAKAWCRFASNGTLESPSHNVSGVVRNSVGDYTVSFTVAFSSAVYVASAICQYTGSVSNSNTVVRHETVAPVAGAYRLQVMASANGVLQDSETSIVFFGDQ